LSEVRFFSVPVYASQPQPASGKTGVNVDTALSWRAGREAALHKLYFSTDGQAVADGAALVDAVTEHSYDLGPMNSDSARSITGRSMKSTSQDTQCLAR